ncbi:SPASM domain-containing protein [Streptomyces sp. PSKA01]|uniref:SPASM domain-containing protein n=1 Tax=Streptomyces cupreus TaxID=2759956 RepID=A0A7X1JBF6_9ACTN|nr:SPASM domain-containing protein [Streptomyces cupreus]
MACGQRAVSHIPPSDFVASGAPASFRQCADGKAAILPDGQVVPCVLGRFLPAGNVTTGSLQQVLAGQRWVQVSACIPRGRQSGCTPDEDSCMPSPGAAEGCNPDQDGSDCSPAETPACEPAYD